MNKIILVDPQQIIRGGSFHQPSEDTGKDSSEDDEGSTDISYTTVNCNEDDLDLSGGEERPRNSDSDDSFSEYEEQEGPSAKRIKVKEEDDLTIIENHPTWSFYEPRNKQPNPKFQKHTEAQPIEVASNEEIDFYRLLLDDDILDLLVEQTNIYAQQYIDKTRAAQALTKYSRLNNWQPTSKDEMLCFLGILIWMGLDKKPGINEYWKNMDLYRSKAADYMSRNRFELMIRFFHFSNNALCPPNTASYKIQPMLDILNERFMKYVDIDEKVYLNEYSSRAYVIPGKVGRARDFRIKYRTLTMSGGYSYYTKVYTNTGKRTDYREIVEFVSPILNRGVTLYTGEAVTSVALASILNSKDTNLVGPIDREIADLPDDLLHSDVSRNELAARERDGMIVLKWEIKRNQSKMFLSTKHGKETVQIRSTSARRERPRPKAYQEYLKVVEENSLGKIEEYFPNRRSDKWFKKIGLQVLVVQCVFNAYHLMMKTLPRKNYNATNFRENLCLQLLTKYGTLTQASRHTFLPTSKKISPSSLTHVYISAGRKGNCAICQLKNKEGKKDVKGIKTSIHKCSGCLDKSFMCMDCFFETHTAILK